MSIFRNRRIFLNAVAGVIASLSFSAGTVHAEFLVALGSTTAITNALVTFDSNATTTTSGVIAVTGVSGTLLDIDYRPATGALVGLSSNGGLYTINATTGAATLTSTVSAPLSGVNSRSTLTRRSTGSGSLAIRPRTSGSTSTRGSPSPMLL